MVRLDRNSIREIAEELDCGFDCYYNTKTQEIITVPGFSYLSNEDEFREAFELVFEKIERQKSDLIKFEVLQPYESFTIMESFVNQIAEKKLKEKLENILIGKKPFRNFKYEIDNSDFRQNWFDFKQKQLERIVENRMNNGRTDAQ